MVRPPRPSAAPSKRSSACVGHQVHTAGACDPNHPHLITDVETTPATTPDDNMAAVIHASLAPATSPPGASGRQRLHRCCHARRESARVRRDHRRAGGRRSQVASPSRGGDRAQFLVDWDRHVVTYPMRKQSISW
jgi:transposase